MCFVSNYIVFTIFVAELLSVVKMRFFPNGLPITSSVALSNEDFKLCGEIMCLSILQGGPAPNFLSDEVVDYVLGKKLSPDAVKAKSFKSAVDKVHLLLPTFTRRFLWHRTKPTSS